MIFVKVKKTTKKPTRLTGCRRRQMSKPSSLIQSKGHKQKSKKQAKKSKAKQKL